MFINFSNHPYALWSAEQQAAAQRYGTVVDLAFPAIDPAADETALDSLATVYADHILHLNPDRLLPPQEPGDHLPGRQHPEAQHLRLCRLPPLWLALNFPVRLPPFSRLFLHFGGRLTPAFPTFCQNALLFFVWLWYIGLGIVKAALKSSIFLFFLEQLCYFNLSPQGDENPTILTYMYFIQHFNLSPQGDENQSRGTSAGATG